MTPVNPDGGAARRRDLADFLRTRRTRLIPADYGLPAGPRRRTPGLRREEVAELIGVSPSWYTKLEQGLDIRMSARVLRRLADAFRLTPMERAQLYRLALPEAAETNLPDPDDVLPAVQTMIDALPYSPAFILTPWGEYIGSNAAARIFFGDFETFAGPERNQLVALFLDTKVRRVLPNWRESARQQVAMFRAAYARNAHDDRFQALVTRLMAESREFVSLWNNYDLPAGPSRRLQYSSTDHGELVFECYSFYADLDGNFRVEVFTPLDEGNSRPRMLALVGAALPGR